MIMHYKLVTRKIILTTTWFCR